MARSYTDVEGEGAAWGAAGLVASVVLEVALRPVRASIDLESVVIVYVIIVALCAAVGGRLAGFFASLSAALPTTSSSPPPMRRCGSTPGDRSSPLPCCLWPGCWPA